MKVLLDLSNTAQLDNTPRWFPLKEQNEGLDHGPSRSGSGSQQSPKPSVIKSRSHSIFPDPSKGKSGGPTGAGRTSQLFSLPHMCSTSKAFTTMQIFSFKSTPM